MRAWIAGLVILGLCLGACSDNREENAKQMFQIAKDLQKAYEFDKAIEVLQRIQIDYDNTATAELVPSEIETARDLQTLLLTNERRNMEQLFSKIAFALETYKVSNLAYPSDKQELAKLGVDQQLKWEDVWKREIYYRAYRSSADVPEGEPDGYVLASFGKDGLPGGSGQDIDYFFQNGQAVEAIQFPPEF